jgi:hypothetical protein
MDRPSRRDAHAQADGERLPLVVKDLGSCDLYPQSLAHNPNGRVVTGCGAGEALEFVWGDDSSVFATRESPSSVKLFRNFKEAAALRPDFAVEGLAGGALLSLRAPDFVVFYDWATAKARRAPAPAPSPAARAARGRAGACVAVLADAGSPPAACMALYGSAFVCWGSPVPRGAQPHGRRDARL